MTITKKAEILIPLVASFIVLFLTICAAVYVNNTPRGYVIRRSYGSRYAGDCEPSSYNGPGKGKIVFSQWFYYKNHIIGILQDTGTLSDTENDYFVFNGQNGKILTFNLMNEWRTYINNQKLAPEIWKRWFDWRDLDILNPFAGIYWFCLAIAVFQMAFTFLQIIKYFWRWKFFRIIFIIGVPLVFFQFYESRNDEVPDMNFLPGFIFMFLIFIFFIYAIIKPPVIKDYKIWKIYSYILLATVVLNGLRFLMLVFPQSI